MQQTDTCMQWTAAFFPCFSVVVRLAYTRFQVCADSFRYLSPRESIDRPFALHLSLLPGFQGSSAYKKGIWARQPFCKAKSVLVSTFGEFTEIIRVRTGLRSAIRAVGAKCVNDAPFIRSSTLCKGFLPVLFGLGVGPVCVEVFGVGSRLQGLIGCVRGLCAFVRALWVTRAHARVCLG